jgi:hypothetical protein
MTSSAIAELETPSRVACSELLGSMLVSISLFKAAVLAQQFSHILVGV